MDKQTKTNVKNLVLSLRDDFEKEIENRLSHIGIYKDREWKDGRSLPHLAEDELGRKELDKRRRVAAFIKREEKIGLSLEEATSEFIKECSYTWINRLLGLKCMECQGIIEEVITTRPEFSNRSRVHRDFRETHPDIASKADDGLTATLFSVFEEVTNEIKILFDPSNEYSLIIPRYAMLKKSIEKINTELDYKTYRADDFLGWIYQYFNSREKDRVFEEVNTKKKKIAGSDIINVTQLYTEKYMVHFLVENSLGAMWMEMYLDSHLSSNWEYFVKDPNSSIREPKPIKEITFLDPACGSGHFLLYAFDLYYDMYLEEGKVPKEQIPDHILKYNLHGIDIDQRAIQLTALGLYMKAKSKNSDVKIQHMNLVSADAIMQDKEILEEFLQEFEGDRIAQKLIRTIWEGLENVRELGSLLRVEEQIDTVIEHKKDKRIDFYEDNTQKNWNQWKQDLLKSIRKYYEKASQSFDINKQMFANEAYKGVQLLDLLEQKYDVVATNPPYMSNRNMNTKIKEYTKEYYKSSNSDLYSAFIERCTDFSEKNGFVSMITQHSFMFLDTFSNLRKKLLNRVAIRNLAHLGPKAFEDIGGEVVNTVMFTLKNAKVDYISTFIRLVDDQNKSIKLMEIIENNESHIYQIRQEIFKLISGYPFVYFVSQSIINLFKYEKFESIIDIPGSQNITANNDKYLRFFWEVPVESIGKESDWVLYAKGGEFCKFYGNLELIVAWNEKARKFYKNNRTSNLLNESYWYREGATYTEISSNGFNMRYLPPECIFDKKGPSLFLKSSTIDIYFVIGFCNTPLFSYLVHLLNPTISYQINDVKRIPFVSPGVRCKELVSNATLACTKIKKDLLVFKLNDYTFSTTGIQWGYNKRNGEN